MCTLDDGRNLYSISIMRRNRETPLDNKFISTFLKMTICIRYMCSKERVTCLRCRSVKKLALVLCLYRQVRFSSCPHGQNKPEVEEKGFSWCLDISVKIWVLQMYSLQRFHQHQWISMTLQFYKPNVQNLWATLQANLKFSDKVQKFHLTSLVRNPKSILYIFTNLPSLTINLKCIPKIKSFTLQALCAIQKAPPSSPSMWPHPPHRWTDLSTKK